MVSKMEWFEELDFDENPLDTNPKKFADKLVGLNEELEELLYRAAASSMVFLEGKNGFGKTSLLWNLIKKYKGRGKIIYVDCEKLDKELNIEQLLVRKHGLSGRLFKKMPRNMILLLDNVKELSPTNTERVKFFFDQGYLRSVVFTGTDYSKLKFSESLKQRIGNRIIRLKELDNYQAVAIVRNRIEDIEMISDELIQEIFKISKKNPLKLLQNCETVFAHAVESNEDKISKKHLKLIEG